MSSISCGLAALLSTARPSTTQKVSIRGTESLVWRKNEVTRKHKTGSSLRASLTRENSPKTLTRQTADRYRQGMAIDSGAGYRQIFVVRQFEVGSDQNATIECILNQLQETAVNHLRVAGIVGDEFGVSPGMLKHNLIWIMSKLKVEIDNYPTWDDVLEVDTWVRPQGKIAVQYDWTIRNLMTGKLHARAKSCCMMMNEKTRRLSKIPDEVRDELSQVLIEKKEVDQQKMTIEKIEKPVDAKYVKENLKPKRSDLDMNKHVNNSKYANWMIEAIPDQILKDYQLSSITLEYKRECGILDTIHSLCQPDKDNEAFEVGHGDCEREDIYDSLLGFTHLLQVQGVEKNEETVRGRTTWKRSNT
ncbi:hypothetical protein ACFE04_009524 [Oxalis oulophora]